MKRPRREFPGTSSYRDRHGKRRWRYRKGAFSADLGALAYGSEEFRAAYDRAVRREAQREGVGAGRTRPGSMADLIRAYYASPAFRDLAPSTQRTYRSVIEPLRAAHADRMVADLLPRHVETLMAKKADTPAAANNLRKRLVSILDHAIRLGWITGNPARSARPYRVRSEGFHTWSEAEIAAFLDVHGPGTLARRAMILMLCTGAARADACALGWQHVRDGRLAYRRIKTRRSGGHLIDIPLHPDLKAEIAACDRSALTFLQTAEGRARSPNGLGNLMRTWCDEAGLPECSSHGLRKAIARRLAEAGATPNEIAAVTGHKSLVEVTRYTAAADRPRLADRAFEKAAKGTKRAQKLANFRKGSPDVLDK
jgi:integrase